MGTRALVVLAAGQGRRFGGCKQLTPVGPHGEVLMDYTLYRARRAGFERIIVVTRRDLDASMRQHFAVIGGSPVELVHQPAQARGTVPAILAARPRLDDHEPFGVVNADDLYPLEAMQALWAWGSSGHMVVGFPLAATMLSGSATVNRALCRLDSGVYGGVDGGRRLVGLVGLVEAAVTERAGAFMARERGQTDDRPVGGDQLVSMNAWALRPSIWPELSAATEGSSGRDEVLLPVVMGDLVDRGEVTVTVVPVEGSCIGITWPGELDTVRAMVGRLVDAGQLPQLPGVSGLVPFEADGAPS